MPELSESGREQERESFESFIMERTRANPSISIEEALEQYIEKHNLAVPCHPDEPARAISARTMLQVLEESSFADDCDDPQFQKYLSGLRYLVKMYDTLSPQARKLMKEKEENGEQSR